MDKNYNVDDILSEIKSRKLRQRSGEGDGSRSTASPVVDLDFKAARRDARPAADPEPSDLPASPEEDGDGAGDDLGIAPTDLSHDPASRKQNPLEFSGHVRPITDRAKMRPSKIQPPPPDIQPQFRFTPVDDEQPDTPADLTSFAVDGFGVEPPPAAPFGGDLTGELPPPPLRSATREHTRVLPKFPTGKDINPDELPRRLSLLEAAAEGPYYDDEDEDDPVPEHAKTDFSEYNSVGDRRDVATDIARVKLWLFIRTAVTALLTAALIYLAFAGRYVIPIPASIEPDMARPDSVRAYLTACTVITVIVGLVNSSAVGGGLLSLLKMRANSDTLSALALLAAVAQGVVGLTNPDMVDPTALSMYFPVAALAMLFGAFGKMTMINRIQQNFRIISSDRKKRALLAVDNDEFCHEFIPDAIRRPTITYSAGADFFTDFLGLSYSDKYDVGINRSVAPVCLVGAVLVGIISYLLTWDALAAASALTAILCVSATFSSTFIENIPLGKLTKKLAPLGGMVSGNKAVEDFCDTSAVILTETDFFPEGNIRLRGIKSYAKGRIDEAILDAASVICAMDGALKPVFMQMIGGNRKLLKKVDNIVYENGMGVSAWVDQRRVLIGNRTLMVNHGIAVPPEAKVGQIRSPEDGELIYLSNSGEVSALFVVSYHIDEDLAAQLDLLAARDVLLIVHTCDANITPHRLWELYGYPEELITVLPAERHKLYEEMAKPRENAIAEIVYTGRTATMIAAILACFNARTSILSATVIQLIQIVLGYGLVAFMAFMGIIGSLTAVQLSVYQLFWFLAIFIVQKTKQP